MRKNNHEPFDVKSDLRMWKSASSEPPIPNQVAKGLRDANQLAKLIVDSATGEAEDSVVESKRKTTQRASRWRIERRQALQEARCLSWRDMTHVRLRPHHRQPKEHQRQFEIGPASCLRSSRLMA